MAALEDSEVPGGAEMAVESMPCLVGSQWGKPVVLPTETIDGRACVALCAFASWVNKALCGSARGACSEVVAAFILEVYAALDPAKKSGDDSGGEASGGSCPDSRGGGSSPVSAGGGSCPESAGFGSCPESAGGGSCPAGPPAQTALRGYDALGMQSDSDFENLVAQGQDTKPRSRRRLAPPAVWSTVLVRGQELTLRRRPRGRGLLLPLKGPEIPLVLGMLRADMTAMAEMTVQPKAGVRKRLRADRTALSLVESDTGRVLWLPSQCSWQVLYRDAEGVLRRTARGFRVPVRSVAGAFMTEAERDTARGGLLVLARQRWNQLDKSDAVRYDSTLCELEDAS